MKNLPDVASIDIQTEIQWYMRPYLLDFLIEAHAAFALLPETLFLTINILDRYCSKRVVYRRHYQLVGCTALLIAAKYNECSKKVPHIKELANMCCSLYDEDMFTQMERHVMVTLDWSIGAPTVDAFIQNTLEEEVYDPELEHMALYLSEIALFHKEFVSKLPSEIAKATLALSRIILGRPQCTIEYDSQLLVALSQQIHRPSTILLHKYKSSHMSRVSVTLEDFLNRHAAIQRMSHVPPPTPPSDIPSPGGPDNTVNLDPYRTPQKSNQFGNMAHGYHTPPITPDIECFEGYNPGMNSRRYPSTPTPCSNTMSTQPILPSSCGMGGNAYAYHPDPMSCV